MPHNALDTLRGQTRCPDCNALDTADRRATCNLHPCPLRGLRRPPAVKPPMPTWIVGTPGEWDHEIIRAATREAAILLRCDECEGEDDEDFAGPNGCDCEPCLARGGYEATRVPEWDGRPKSSIGSGDWLDRGSEAICSRCYYETAKEMCGHNVGGKAVCEDCMTLADWDIVDPEHAAELRAEMA